MLKNVPIIGPYVKEELSDKLNEFHIYITDSKYDSCPNRIRGFILWITNFIF